MGTEHGETASFADLYRALTLGGAAALGRDDLGRLAPGAKADITIGDLSALHTGPLEDPIRTLVMNGHGSCVRDVIVDGRHVVKDRVIAGVDPAGLRDWAQGYFNRYKEAHSAWDYQRRPSSALFPPTFPMVERG